MKKFLTALGLCVMMLSVQSCIKDELPNAECDILAVSLSGDVLNRTPIIEKNKVTLVVKNDVSLLTDLAPEFELTPGATIEPPSGTPRNFLFPQTYIVTSQDGQWSKCYTVEVQKNNTINLDYNFENVRVIDGAIMTRYDEFYETGVNGKESLVWASANSAFALSFQASTPQTFPTYQAEGGVNGKCVTLVTRSTGSWGARLKKPIAAGNLFMGTFDSESAVTRPLEATHFGIPFYNIPSSFSGYYKYKAGETYCETDAAGNFVPVAGKKDMFNVYLVLFEPTPEMQWLNGSNVLSADNPNIIGTAEISDRHESDEWVPFAAPFKLRPGKSIDKDKLRNGAYSITVVLSSSQDGDFFSGAVGSTLCVDELLITCVADE